VLGAIVAAPVSSASAAPGDDGFWYYDAYHIQDARDAGLTGEGVTIAVLDSQINLDVPTLKGADIDVQDSACWDESGALIPPTSTDLVAQHGTNVVSYLVGSGDGYPGQTGVKGIVPDAKIIYTMIGRDTGSGTVCESESGTDIPEAKANGVYAAIDAGADIITVSLGGGADVSFVVALALALHEGIVVIASVSNDLLASGNQGNFPGNGNGVIGVQSMDSSTVIQGYSDNEFDSVANVYTDVVGPGVNVVWQGDSTWEEQRYATGTSIATPIVAGFLALVAEKYPDATGNQLIQTLLTNTNAGGHELSYDPDHLYGYGAASATSMLEVDPTKYDDVNLAIDDDPNNDPSAAMIAQPPTLEEFLNDQETGTAAEQLHGDDGDNGGDSPPASQDDGLPVLPIVIGVIGLLLVIAIVIAVVVAKSRRSRTTTTPPPGGPSSRL